MTVISSYKHNTLLSGLHNNSDSRANLLFTHSLNKYRFNVYMQEVVFASFPEGAHGPVAVEKMREIKEKK